MNYTLTAGIFMLFSLTTFAQENRVITVNHLKDDMSHLTASVFHYPGFVEGRVIFKDSVTVDAKMNYHRLYGQILFIGAKRDTLALANPETFHRVLIGTDTFYFFDKGFLRQVTHYPTHNLALKQTIKYIGNEKQGPYGSYSAVSSSNSNSTVTTDDQITQRIELNENLVYKFNNIFYISDAYNNYFRASKKNFYNLFSKHTSQIKEYLSIHEVSFDKQVDLVELLTYIKSL
ncbi:MAG: hypothetical protein H7Y42_19385 [Chitinophagaceae bacterium]|nr:hypothetical protein [Chitinophagaceae bacterium]